MKNIIAMITLCLVIISVISCGQTIRDGEVVKKWHEPESTSTILLPISMFNGKTTTMIMIPYRVTDSEDFCIRIRKLNHAGRVFERTVYLTSDVYNKVSVGDHFTIGSDGRDIGDRNKKVKVKASSK